MEEVFDFTKAIEDVDLNSIFDEIESDAKRKAASAEEPTVEQIVAAEENVTDENILGSLIGEDGEEQNANSKSEPTSTTEKTIAPETPAVSSLTDNPAFYSSIAKALLDDGIFSEYDDAKPDDISTAEDFSDYVEKQISARLEERQKRIDDALNADVPVPVIKQYETALSELDKITEEQLTDEGDSGVELRKTLLYNDFVNRGFSEQRARKEVEKSVSSGYDIDDARDALDSVKKLYRERYDDAIAEAKAAKAKEAADEKKLAEEIKKGILDGQFLGGLDVPKQVREKALSSVIKGTVRDNEGNLYTALQDYERNNRAEFLKNVGLLFTLTDGFKNMDKLIGRQVSKEVKKGIRNLENVLRTSNSLSGGNLSLMDSGNDSSGFASSGKWRLKL